MPSAVVVSARPTINPDRAPSAETIATAEADAESERRAPADDTSTERWPLDPWQIDLHPGEEHQRGQPEIGQEVDHVVEMSPVERRSDQHAEGDLEHDAGDGDPSIGDVGHHGSEGDGSEDDDE